LLYLNVPYEEKEKVKSMYARWDQDKKKWYATNPKFYFRFKEWLEGSSVAQNKVYIAVASRVCWKCNKSTPVYAVAIKAEDIIDLENNIKDMESETGYDMAIIPIDYSLPKDIKFYLEKNTACKVTYSNTTKTNYFANVCEYCNALQGAFFVYDEFDSPFKRNNDGSIKFIEFTLEQDISIDYEVGSALISPAIQLFDENNVVNSHMKISE